MCVFMLHVMFCYNPNTKQNNTKQSINIHAKAYKVFVMRYKAIKH